MHKPNLLRAWLLRAVPGLKDHPQKLHTYVDDGQIAMSVGEKLSYVYRYKLTVVIEDFSAESHNIFVPLLAWLSQYQPDIFDDNGAGLSTNIDILDNDKGNFEFSIALWEIALVNQTSDGGWAVSYPTPPKFEAEFDPPTNGARLWQLYLNQSLVAAHPDHLPPGVDPDGLFTQPEAYPPRPNAGVRPSYESAYPFVVPATPSPDDILDFISNLDEALNV
jgi:P2 phage tail completion protein R (GpR)